MKETYASWTQLDTDAFDGRRERGMGCETKLGNIGEVRETVRKLIRVARMGGARVAKARAMRIFCKDLPPNL